MIDYLDEILPCWQRCCLVGDATINLLDFVLVTGSASPEGMVRVSGSLLGTWFEGFGIERVALSIDITATLVMVVMACHATRLTMGLPKSIKYNYTNKRKEV
jgi:hypothetical protein